MDNLEQIYMNNSGQPIQQPTKNAYQQNLSNPVQEQKNSYSTRDILGMIGTVGTKNQAAAQAYLTEFQKETTNPTSQWYNPYNQPTNRAVSNLAAYGFDTNNLNDDWFNQNNGWIASNLLYNGTTNSPSKPGKKATRDQLIAYELYQYQKSEGATRKAEQQWDALQQELTYLAQDKSRNYSDEDILKKIDWSKYKELTSMDDNKYYQPNEYNRSIGYSKDAMYGVLWKARNPEYNGDMFGAMANSAMGNGNVWNDNPEISAKLNWNNADTYSPFSVGMTAGEEGRYFGVYSFGEKEIERLQNRLDPKTGEPLDPNDATAMKMRDNVLSANETTNQAKRELGVFQKKLDEKLKDVTRPEEAQKIVEDLLDSEVYDKETRESITFDTLKKMDASLNGSPDSLVKTTDAIDYRKQDMVKYAMDRINNNATRKTGSEKENETNQLIARASSGASDVGGNAYVPKTQAEIEEEKAINEKVREAAETVDGVASDNEKTVMKNAGSPFFRKAVDYFNKVKSSFDTARVLLNKSGEDATKSYFNTMMDTMKDVGYYNAREERLAMNQERYSELEKKYGDIELLQQEAEPRKQFNIGDITFVMDLKEGDPEKNIPAEYVISDFYAPGRGGGMIMDEIIDYGNDDDKIAEAEKIKEEATAEVNKILAAHKKAESYGEGWKNEVNEYKTLSGKIQADEQWLDENKSDYDAKNSQLQEQNSSLNRMRILMRWLGADTKGMDEADTYLSFMSQFYNEPQLNNSDETKLQFIDRMAEMSGKPYTRDYQSEQIHNGMEEIDRQLDYIQMTEEYIQENGLQIPAEVQRNMELTKQDLENERKAYEYSSILTDNDPLEINKAVAAGKEFEQKYGKGNMDYWVTLFPNADIFKTIGNQERYVDSEGNFHSDIVSEDDQKTYYYLLGKKVMEMGDSLDEAISQIGTDPDKTEAALREAFSDAGEYQRFMEDEDTGYGVWSIREFDRSASYGSKLVESGFGGGLQANLMATGVSAAESIASALELLDTAVSGGRFNTKSFARRFGAFKEQTREATRQSILDEWGTNGQENFLTKIANLGYEIYCNRGDSLMNSMVFGSIFNIGGPVGDMLNEFLGSMPMGASASLSSAAEAVENGASTNQAWLIAGTTFLAETLTEAITLSNIKEAFNFSEGLTMDSLGSIVKDWLTRSGLEEMTGETANDLFENYFNKKAEEWFQNPNFESDHTKMVERFLGEGMTPDEAEAAAYEEEIKGMLHTALVSYISAGSNVLISTGKAAVNSVDYYKSTAKKLQKNGYNVSTMGLMWNDWKNRKSTTVSAPQTSAESRPAKGAPAPNTQGIQNAPIASKASAQEAGTAVAEEGTEQKQNATPEQQEAASSVISLENAKDGDSNTQTASMASVLDTGLAVDPAIVDRAGAAASMIGNVFGENASSQVQDIIIGATDGKVNLTLVKTAIQNAVLGNGEATRLVQSEAFQNANAQEKAQMLADTVGADNDNQEVQSNIYGAVRDFRVAKGISDLAAEGHFDQAQEAQNNAKKSARTASQAQEDLKVRQDELQAAEGNRKAADELAIQEPSLDHTKEAQQAQAKLISATAVEQEYEQSAKNAEAAKQEAEAKAKKVTEDAMSSARQMSNDAMIQEDQQREEIAAQEAEQQRIADEQAAQAQAEEDIRTGKAQEDADLAAIDAQIEKLNVKGEQAEKIRQQLHQFYQDMNNGNIDTSKMLTDAESALALGALSRRLGVAIEVGPLEEGRDGKYSNGKIVLSNKLTVGQAMVEVAMHEITHSLEGTKNYEKYKSTVLGILYSTPEQLQAAVSERIARYARQGVTLTEGEAEAELVADFAKDTKRFANRDTIARMMDAGLGGKMRNTLHNVNQFLKNLKLNGQERVNAENLRKAERLYIKAINDRRSINTHPSSEQFSVNQFAQAAGLFYNEVEIKGKNGNIIAMPGVYNVDPALLNDPNYKGPKPVRIEQVTPEMMEKTPVGKLTNAALALGTMDRETVGKVHKMFADLMTMCTNLQDTNLVWEIAGSTLYSEFSAIKANSDKQYSTTVDFGTICTKTQAVITQLSRDMLRLGRGLTSQEILQVYNDVYNADLKVPCPVCYVFSRWLGVPSLLENIRQYQNRFLGEEGAEVDQAETQRRINEFIEKAQSDYGIDKKSAKGLELYNQNLAKERQNALDRQNRIKNGKDGIAELEAKIAKYRDQLAQKPTRRDWQNNLAKAEQKLAEQKEALAQAEADYDNAVINVYAKAINKKKADIESSIKDKLVAIEGNDKGKRGVNDDIRDAIKEGKPYDKLEEKRTKLYADIDALRAQLREVDAYNWVTQALCRMTPEGEFVIDPEFKRTKNEILLDLNRTGEFAKDIKNWTYRSTRGAGMGKAILPYSGATIGDSVLGVDSRVMSNPFNDGDGKGAFDALRSAILKAKRQNLIGGQRFQSTSDFRPEWGLDYIMTFVEQQAIGSNGQLYTKVNEAVPLYASVGIDTNCSIMPYANGYHEPAAGEIEKMSEMERKSRVVTFKDADGTEKTVILDFSDVTGMEYGAARIFSKSFDNVQMIMVGINDIHIRACLGSEEIDFVIPWHASGNTKGQLASMMKTVNETLTNSSDYTKTQTDAIANKEGLKEAHTKLDNGETLTDAEKELIRKEQRRDARIRLLTGSTLTSTDLERIAESEFLTSLYERFEGKTLDGKELPHDSNYWIEVPDSEGNINPERLKMTSGQAEQIFPYEYWDTSLTKDQADENGWRFVQYCQELGLVPRFSGANQKDDSTGEVKRFGNFSGAVYDENGNITGYNRDLMAKGYWKTLIDRKMYDNNGNYRTQKQIDASQVKAGDLMQDENGNRIHVGSNIPDQTSGATYRGEEAEAKYKKADQALLERIKEKAAKGDKQAISDLEHMNAYDNAKAEINTQYDLSGEINPQADLTQGQMLQIMQDAGVDARSAMDRGDINAAREAFANVPDNEKTTLEKITGFPLSKEIQDIVSKLDRGEDITLEEYYNVPEVKIAREKKREGFSLDPKMMKKYKGGTDYIAKVQAELPPEKVAEQTRIKNELDADGCMILNSEGKLEHGGEVIRGRRFDVVVGLAAAGKSSIADYISYKYHSGFLDSDDAKKKLEGYDDGINASYVHPESKFINDWRTLEAVERGDNVILPVVGDNDSPQEFLAKIQPFIDSGYDIHLHKVDLPKNKAIGRAIGRYINQGRYIDLAILMEMDPDKIDNIFNALKKDGVISGYAEWNNDVPRGQHPTVVESSGTDETDIFNLQLPEGLRSDMENGVETGSEVNGTRIEDGLADGSRYSGLTETDENGTVEEDGAFSIPDDTGNMNLTEGEMLQILQDAGVSTAGNSSLPGQPTTLPGMPVDEEGNAYRQFGRIKAQQSNALHEDVKSYLYNHSAYTPDTNSAQIDRAISWVQSNASQSDPDGFFSSLQKAQNGDFDSISADGQARMLTLMGMAALKGEETGDHSAELMLADLFNKQGTEAGRALQARKMFRLMTPVGRMATLNKMADQINEEYGKKGNERRVRLSDWTLQAAAVAESEEDFQKVQKAAAAELASQMPANWKEKFTAIRMLSMLGNPRTHIRNLVGNLAFMPAVSLKNKIGAGLEAAFVKKGNRTKTIGLATPESRAFAKQYAKQIEGLLRGESKYNEGNAVQQERKIFGQGNGIISKSLGRLTQFLVDANGNALETEDWIFLNRHFRNAFAGYMTANGLTEADMKGDTLDKATAYAINEAHKATYRDANEVANWMNKVKNPAAKFVINAVLPFKKTPMNILKRGVEYSPVSIIRSLTSDAKHLKQWNAYQRGELSVLPEKAISPAQYIDRAASGLSGTLIVGLGALLSSLGFVRGGMDDDDDEFDKLNGSQEYSLEIGGVSFTIDWAAPICMPLFVGATVMEEAKKAASGRGEGVSIGSVLDSILGIAEPVTQLSMLDGLNSVLNPSNYGDTDSLIQVGEKVITNYATSYVPTFLGQVARTIDTTRRRNFVESGADLKVFRSALEQVENKIPFLSQKNIPYRNVWGEADVSPQGWAAIENFLSPGYGNTLKNDPVTNELKRIYQKTGNPSMIPKAAGKTVTINGKNTPLNAEQYDQYVVDRGQTAYNCIKDLMESPVWQICDDNTRALMITDAWSYANQIGRHNVDNRIKKDSWVANAEHNGNFVDVAIERAADSNRTDYIKGYGQTMAEAMDSNDSEMFDLSVTALEEAGATEAEIRGSLRDYFKPLYQVAFEENDTNTMDLIEEKLLDVGVGFKGKDIAGWIPSEAKEKEIDQRWLNMEEDNQ